MNDMAAYTAIARLEQPAPAVYLHCAIALAGRTLGAETFRLVGIQGSEQVSEHFEFHLELHGNTDYAQPPLRFDQIMGRPVSFAVQLPVAGAVADDPGWADERFAQALSGQAVDGLSLFNGIAAGFAMEIPGVYRLTVRPALWRLTLTNHYRVFGKKSVRQAIAAVLDEHRIDYSLERVAGADNLASSRIQDWFQAGETDYDFVRRLMGKAHLYYFYRHTGNAHQLVFDNRPNYPPVFADNRALRYTFTGADALGLAQSDVITEYSFAQNLVSSGVKSVFARQEESWDVDPLPTYQTFEHALPRDPGELPFRLYKVYQYGCSKTEVKDYTDATALTLAASGIQFSGASACALLRAGHSFRVAEDAIPADPAVPVRPCLDGRQFVVTQVEHEASLDGSYGNKFQATDAAELVSGFSIQETQQGTVLAKVVANDGEAAPQGWKFYRKDNFDLKQVTLEDKLATPTEYKAKGVSVVFCTDGPDGVPVWIKLAAHMQTVPEIGATVVVTRASDESELPEIQAIVHNNGNKAVVPGGWTASTSVGNNYNTHYGDGQNISLGINTPQSVLPTAVTTVTDAYNTASALGFSHGHFRDTAYSQGASYSYSTSENGKDGTLSASESYGSTYGKQVGAMSWSTSEFDNTDSRSTVNQLAKSVSTNNIVDSTSTTNVQTSKSTTGTNTATNETGINTVSDTTGVSSTTQLTGMSTSVGATGISSRVDATGVSQSMSATGISGSVQMEGLASQLSLTGMRSNISLTGDSCQLSMTGSETSITACGAQSTVSATGMSSNQSLTGVSNRNDMTGMSVSVGLTGVASNTNVTGMTSGMNVTGVSDDLSIVGVSSRLDMSAVSSNISFSTSAENIHASASQTDVNLIAGGLTGTLSGQVEINQKTLRTMMTAALTIML